MSGAEYFGQTGYSAYPSTANTNNLAAGTNSFPGGCSTPLAVNQIVANLSGEDLEVTRLRFPLPLTASTVATATTIFPLKGTIASPVTGAGASTVVTVPFAVALTPGAGTTTWVSSIPLSSCYHIVNTAGQDCGYVLPLEWDQTGTLWGGPFSVQASTAAGAAIGIGGFLPLGTAVTNGPAFAVAGFAASGSGTAASPYIPGFTVTIPTTPTTTARTNAQLVCYSVTKVGTPEYAVTAPAITA